MRLNDPYLLITKLFKKRISTRDFPFFSKLLDIYTMSNFGAGCDGFRSPKLKEFTKDGNTTCVFLYTVMFKKCTIKFFETRNIGYV